MSITAVRCGAGGYRSRRFVCATRQFTALDYLDPPVLPSLTAFVPETDEPTWRSAQPLTFPRTAGYQLGHDVAIRYTCSPTDADERLASIVTRLCIEEVAGPFAQECRARTLDELVTSLWQAEACGIIPHHLPLVLVVDELNRWSSKEPTASLLAEIVRDQRHARFSLIGLGQQLSTLNPQLLANADALRLGTMPARELADDVYDHLPMHLRNELHRLPEGRRVLDAWPLREPLMVEVPFPNWLIADEGLAVVEARAAQAHNQYLCHEGKRRASDNPIGEMS